MAAITYIQPDGQARTFAVESGATVMNGAMDNGVEGITAECGGGLACGTCHCYVDPAWWDRVGSPSDAERDMLEFAAVDPRPNSRLSCQIDVTDSLDGLIVSLPQAQY